MDDLIARAQAFATQAHAGQARKDAARTPYITHPAEVAARVAALGGSPAAQAAAWLHDTIEDCGVTAETLAAGFGDRVAAIVAELTDTPAPRLHRKRRQVDTAMAKSPEAALVKLADKTANVVSVRRSPPVGWSPARQMAYVDWAEAVVSRLPSLSDDQLAAFRAEASLARQTIAARDDGRPEAR
jgi:(p)ppGpp synthase/HD superfamily hydrolase